MRFVLILTFTFTCGLVHASSRNLSLCALVAQGLHNSFEIIEGVEDEKIHQALVDGQSLIRPVRQNTSDGGLILIQRFEKFRRASQLRLDEKVHFKNDPQDLERWLFESPEGWTLFTPYEFEWQSAFEGEFSALKRPDRIIARYDIAHVLGFDQIPVAVEVEIGGVRGRLEVITEKTPPSAPVETRRDEILSNYLFNNKTVGVIKAKHSNGDPLHLIVQDAFQNDGSLLQYSTDFYFSWFLAKQLVGPSLAQTVTLMKNQNVRTKLLSLFNDYDMPEIGRYILFSDRMTVLINAYDKKDLR